MNILLFGATGGTGKEILAKLLGANHQVAALVRNPENLKDISEHQRLNIIRGSIHNPDTYQKAMNNCDLVISALGTGTSRKPTEVYSKGGQQIISAMRKANKKRLITLTAGAFDPTDPATQNFIVKYIVQPLFKNIYADMRRWETILENSKDIDWTIVRPSRLTNGKEKGNYRVGLNHCPKRGSKISRKDLADFIVKQLDNETYVRQKAVIAY